MSAVEPFKCPHCNRPWDETQAAIRRMSRITRGEAQLEADMECPGFISDLRLVLQALPAGTPS